MKSLSKVTKKFLGAKYKFGGKSKEDGFDCLSLLRAYCKEMEFSIPDEIDGIDLENGYKETYLNGDWKEIYLRYIESLGKIIPVEFSRSGDILVIVNENLVSAGINVGNGKALIITKHGVGTWPLSVLKIKEAVRIK